MGVRVERFEGLIEEAVRRAGVGEPRSRRARAANGCSRRSPAARRRGRRAAAGLRRGRSASCSPNCRCGASSPARLRGGARELGGAGRRRHAHARSSGGCTPTTARRSSGSGGSTREQRAVRALDALRRTPGAVGRRRRSLFYGFDDLTRAAARRDRDARPGASTRGHRLARLRARAESPSPAAPATFQALAPLAERASPSCRRAPSTTRRRRARRSSHLERSLFEPDAGRVEPAAAVQPARGRRRTGRAGAGRRARSRALLRGGHAARRRSRWSRGSPRLGAELLEEVFAAARHPDCAARRRRRSATRAIGRALIGLLRCLRAPASARRASAADLLAWLRAPGLLERPELADRLEAELTRARARGAPTQARALWEERHWPLERDRAAARGRRPGPAGADRAGRARAASWLFARSAARAARACSRATSSRRRARSPRAAGRSASCASSRALRPSSRPATRPSWRDVLERVELLGGERARAGGGGRARPAGAARPARPGAVPLRPAGGRLPGPRAARSRCSRRRSGARLAELRAAPRRARGRARRPSATCSTRPSRARRSCSC